jgi:dihydroorotate dehydrogenase
VRELSAGTRTPLALKISPDLATPDAVALSAAAVEAGARAVIVANTTTDYSLVPGVEQRGGLSGAVLRDRSFALLAAVARELYPSAVLISVGGVDSAGEAYRRLRAGASLVELYTALVYHGPRVAGSINRGLVDLLERDGARRLEELVGADRR